MTDIKTNAKITCPECGHTEEVEMPLDYCQISYECPQCLATIRSKKGYCCVFCSYAGANCASNLQYEQMQFCPSVPKEYDGHFMPAKANEIRDLFPIIMTNLYIEEHIYLQ